MDKQRKTKSYAAEKQVRPIGSVERIPQDIAMVTPQSPTPMFNGLDDDLYSDAKYAHEINDKMRVPKRIKATGEYSNEDLLLSNQNGMISSWNYHDKIDMNVPDRIVVLGHNQHLETRSAPREIQLENSILPKNPSVGLVRVQTPPRIITLTDQHFPSASEESSPIRANGHHLYGNDLDEDADDEEVHATQYVRANGVARMGFQGNDTNSVESDSQVSKICHTSNNFHLVFQFDCKCL